MNTAPAPARRASFIDPFPLSSHEHHPPHSIAAVVPVPAGGEQFIFWASDMTVLDDAGSEIQVPRPEFNPDVPSVFWA